MGNIRTRSAFAEAVVVECSADFNYRFTVLVKSYTDGTRTADDLKWYSDIKAELRKYDIPVDDISKFAKAVNRIRQYGYDVGKLQVNFQSFNHSKATQNASR